MTKHIDANHKPHPFISGLVKNCSVEDIRKKLRTDTSFAKTFQKRLSDCDYWKLDQKYQNVISNVAENDVGVLKVYLSFLKTKVTKNLSLITNALFARLSYTDKIEAADLLFENEIDINFQLFLTLQTPLHNAVVSNQLKMARWLLTHGAKVDIKDASGETPLHLASQFGRQEICELLLQNKANVEEPNAQGFRPLHLAVQSGNQELVKFFLEQNAKPNVYNKKGFTPLHIACELQNIFIVTLLCGFGADVNGRLEAPPSNSSVGSPLHIAAQEQNCTIVAFLLSKNADPTLKGSHQRTSLHIACNLGDFECVNLLCRKELILQQDDKGNTAFHHAASEASSQVIQLLLSHEKGWYTKNEEGASPLNYAVSEEKKEIIGLLLFSDFKTLTFPQLVERIKADILYAQWFVNFIECLDLDTLTPKHKATCEALKQQAALSFKSAHKQLSIQQAAPDFEEEHAKLNFIEELKKCSKEELAFKLSKDPFYARIFIGQAHKADLSVLSQDLHTKLVSVMDIKADEFKAFLQCITTNIPSKADFLEVLSGFLLRRVSLGEGEIDSVNLLLKSGAPINAQNGSRQTAMHLCATFGDVKMCKLLLLHNPDLTIKDSVGNTPLHIAALRGFPDLIEDLINAGADINAETDAKVTPLHMMCTHRRILTVNFFLSKGANPNVQDIAGNSPLHYCAREGFSEGIEALLRSHANPALKNDDLQIPLHQAAGKGNLQCVRLLSSEALVQEKDIQGNIPLHYAANQGHTEAFQFLAQLGSDYNQKNESGFSPFEICILNRNEGLFDLFISNELKKKKEPVVEEPKAPEKPKKAKKKKKKKKHSAKTQEAPIQNPPAIEKIEKKEKEKEKEKDKALDALLLSACSQGDDRNILACLDQGADINAQNQAGNTPLHFAVSLGSISLVNALLLRKADRTLKNLNKETPLDIAMLLSDELLKNLLRNELSKEELQIALQTEEEDRASFNQEPDKK